MASFWGLGISIDGGEARTNLLTSFRSRSAVLGRFLIGLTLLEESLGDEDLLVGGD